MHKGHTEGQTKRGLSNICLDVSNLLLKVKQKIDRFTYLNLYVNNDNRALFSVGNEHTEKDFRILLSPKLFLTITED